MFKKYPAIRSFISYCGTFKKPFLATAIVFALADIVITLVPWIIGKLTGSLTSHDSSGILIWTVLVIAASVGHDIFWRSAEFMNWKLLIEPSNRYEDIVFQNVLRHDYGYFVNNFTGKISSYIASLGRSFREVRTDFHYQYINLIVSLPVILITMFTVNIYTGLIFSAGIILMYVTGRILAREMSKAERKTADKQSSLDGFAVDSIANFVTVKAFRSERREAMRIYDARRGVIDAAKYSFFKAVLFWGFMSICVRWLIWSAAFIVNVYLYVHGQIGLAQVTTFLTAIVLFSNFIWEVVWDTSQLNIKIANIEEAYKYLFGERNIISDSSRDDEPIPRLEHFNTSLELRNLSFAYPDKPDVPVLDDINITIKQGEKIGLVGHSGGGKSTLMSLMLGYYPLKPGELLVDGTEADNRSLTDLIAFVPQDTAMFHRTIRENIAYGRPDATESEVIAAAEHAQAHEFISHLSEGYDTLVGERGVKLSGGQRQRVAIARAILKQAPILMLDEATSALDSESEKLIQKALKDLLKDRTAIVIAHRLSTIQKMDRIIVIEKGSIIEQGSHQELLKLGGEYARLWQHQSGGFIDE
ncbi:MAG TPA: ABC transporter ATP-binding protein [Candidatus Saccharimonadales bacterium]|nr:ABC transporter ATP-binding protein [Candidatus Saccharimonadales bacterium]